jgi:phage terminase Nu1 subunit (DNA packaging protein)
MTDATITTPDRPKRKRGNGTAHAPLLVSGNKLAVHFGVVRQRIDQLTAQGVIERRSDGLFDQDRSRLKYLNHLRSEHWRSPRAAADAELASAKAALLRIRIEEKQRTLVRQDDVDALIDQIAGVTLTALSSLPARCAPRGDLAIRRSIERVVFEVRREIAEACSKRADETGEPPLDEQ